MTVEKAGVGLFLALCLAAAFFALVYPSMQPGRDVLALPSIELPKLPAVQQPARSAPAPPQAGENVDTSGAAGHVSTKHPAALAIFEALQAGFCTPSVYVAPPCNHTADGTKGYLVCPGFPDGVGIVPLRYDAIQGQWVAMTAFYADEGYVQRTIARDNCKPLDPAVLGMAFRFTEVIRDGNE